MTLGELVDFERINRRQTRLTVGAANVGTGEMRYFDSRDMALDVRHVMASGALPPAFPAVRIDGELYWDGGILSNTPVEAVFDDNPRRELAGLRRAYLEPARQRAGHDVAGDEPPEGHPVFQPRGQPHRPPEADPSPAPRDRRAR